MTYELRFENHPDPVEVAAGYGFKAPKSWGRIVRDSETDDCCPELAELDEKIQEEEFKLSELVASITEFEKEVGRYDIRILTTEGRDRRAMLASARFLKVQELHEMEARVQTEIGHQQARVASLRRLRSEKRKDLSK